MDDAYIRDIADVIERDIEPNQEPIEVNNIERPKKKPGCGAIAMGLGEKRSDQFQHIEEELLGPPKNTNVNCADQEERKQWID